MVTPWRRAGMVLATLTVAGFLLTPATAATFLTKKKADKRYINVGEKATDADLLDGQNSTAFLGADQKAVDADKLDGLDASELQPAYKTTIIVSPVGTREANGTALLNAVNGITGNTGPSPIAYLVKVEPGLYDLGSTPLQMKINVDIEGSGENTTVILGDGAQAPGTATVLGAPNSELRLLSVASQGGSYATAIRLTSASDIRWVSAFAQGGAVANKGIEVASGPSMLRDLSVFASAPVNSNAYGIFSTGNPYMSNGFIQVSGGTASYAVYIEANEFNIDGSLLIGGTDAVSEAGPDGTIVRVGASRLQGGVSGSVICAQSYDGNYIAAGNNTCPS
jgi:hypothetical protein